MTPAPWFVGIDVSKAQLDIALRPEGRFVVPMMRPGVPAGARPTGRAAGASSREAEHQCLNV
jgi:hypothetical protein